MAARFRYRESGTTSEIGLRDQSDSLRRKVRIVDQSAIV
jgi:hypothetical protein